MPLDNTVRCNAKDAPRVNLNKYQTLYDVLPVGLTTTDAAGAIVEGNWTAETILGMTRLRYDRKQIDRPEWRIIRPDGSPMLPDKFAGTRALKENRRIENVVMGGSKTRARSSGLRLQPRRLLWKTMVLPLPAATSASSGGSRKISVRLWPRRMRPVAPKRR